MEIEEKLKQLGLTNNEIGVYLALLQKGKSTATIIRKDTKIVNSQVYSALDMLIAKGLVMYEKRAQGKLYVAADPIVLRELLNQRMQEVEKVLPLLRQIRRTENVETDTAIYEGVQGFKTAMVTLSQSCPQGETIKIIGFSNQAYKNAQLAAILRDVNKISIRKKHRFKMILDDPRNTFYTQRSAEGISQIRFMRRGFVSPAAIDIFQDQVYILLWDEHPYAICIKNKNIAQGFSIYFDFLWNMAKQ